MLSKFLDIKNELIFLSIALLSTACAPANLVEVTPSIPGPQITAGDQGVADIAETPAAGQISDSGAVSMQVGTTLSPKWDVRQHARSR